MIIDYIKSTIQLARVTIYKNTKDAIWATYNGKKYKIMKSDETAFYQGFGGGLQSAGLGLQLAIDLPVFNEKIFLDEQAPSDFYEVMIFHELREMEYQEAGLDQPHNRAVADETLYVLKYLPPTQHMAYFQFATKIRSEAIKLEKERQILFKKNQRKAKLASKRCFLKNKALIEKVLTEDFCQFGRILLVPNFSKNLIQTQNGVLGIEMIEIENQAHYQLYGSFSYQIKPITAERSEIRGKYTFDCDFSYHLPPLVEELIIAELNKSGRCINYISGERFYYDFNVNLQELVKIYRTVQNLYAQAIPQYLFPA